MRNDVLQNYLDQFLKYLADNFDNLKFQDVNKVAIFRPPNSYILHCHSKCGLFTIYLCHVLAYCIVTAQFTLHIWLNYNTKLKIFVNFIYSGLFIIVTI